MRNKAKKLYGDQVSQTLQDNAKLRAETATVSKDNAETEKTTAFWKKTVENAKKLGQAISGN